MYILGRGMTQLRGAAEKVQHIANGVLSGASEYFIRMSWSTGV